MARRILTFHCHEPYVHHLAKLGYPLDVVVGLPGRLVNVWDERAGPGSDNVTPVHMNDLNRRGPYVAALCHNISDLIAIKHLEVPRVLILHENLRDRATREGCSLRVEDMQRTVRAYLRLVGGVVVAASKPNLLSWGVQGTVIEPPAEANEYGECHLQWGTQQVLAHSELAAQESESYRPSVPQRFSVVRFLKCWHAAITEAQVRQQCVPWKSRNIAN